MSYAVFLVSVYRSAQNPKRRSVLGGVDNVPTFSIMYWANVWSRKRSSRFRDAGEDIRLSTPRDSPRERLRPLIGRASRGGAWDMKSSTEAKNVSVYRGSGENKTTLPKQPKTTRSNPVVCEFSEFADSRYIILNWTEKFFSPSRFTCYC